VHVASFPLEIRGDALTVSGIVGAGGTPTIGFPSGLYAAEVFAGPGGPVLVVVARSKTPRSVSVLDRSTKGGHVYNPSVDNQ
jgi:hypothetical protein